jgi:hypothetical protein
MEWQPIETAPIDVPVRLGGWRRAYGKDGMEWATDIGAAWESERGFFRTKIKRGWRSEYTHWMPLPPPPVQP